MAVYLLSMTKFKLSRKTQSFGGCAWAPGATVHGALLSGPAGCAIRHTDVWDVYHLAF